MTPRVSVVLPMHNAETFVERAIASIALQAVAGIEVIVVDDASRDCSVAVARASLERFKLRFRLLTQGTSLGPASTRNVGVRAASGVYVAFLDADDEWLPDKLRLQLEMLDDDPGITLCGCQAVQVDEQGRFQGYLFRKLPNRLPDGWRRLLWQCYVHTSCAVARRRDLGIAPFDAELRVGEDRDLWIKLATNGAVGLVQEPLVRIRLLDGSFMRSNQNLILTQTRPMIDRHIRAFRGSLPYYDRILAHACLHSQVGKALCRDPATYWRAARHLLAAALVGHSPISNLRDLVYGAPLLRDLKALVKRHLGEA